MCVFLFFFYFCFCCDTLSLKTYPFAPLFHPLIVIMEEREGKTDSRELHEEDGSKNTVTVKVLFIFARFFSCVFLLFLHSLFTLLLGFFLDVYIDWHGGRCPGISFDLVFVSLTCCLYCVA